MHAREPTNTVAKLTMITSPEGPSPSPSTAPDEGGVADLQARVVAAASYAALSVATHHWASHGGDLATHIRVALDGLRNI